MACNFKLCGSLENHVKQVSWMENALVFYELHVTIHLSKLTICSDKAEMIS